MTDVKSKLIKSIVDGEKAIVEMQKMEERTPSFPKVKIEATKLTEYLNDLDISATARKQIFSITDGIFNELEAAAFEAACNFMSILYDGEELDYMKPETEAEADK